MTLRSFCNRTRRNDPKTFVLFRKIGKESADSVSWNTPSYCRASFNIATAFFVTIFFLFFFFFPGLTFNLSVCKRALKQFLHGSRLVFPDGLRPPRLLLLDALLPLGDGGSEVERLRVERFWVSVLHACLNRDRSYTGLLSYTALLLSIDRTFLVLFQHHSIPCDSQPLHLFQSFRFCGQIFVIEVSDLCFFSPSS